MGERALGWGLRLLGITFSLGPIVACFAAYDWDPMATLTPSPNPLEELGQLEELFGENNIEVIENRIVGDTLEITFRLTSPIGYVLKINGFSFEITCALEPTTPYLTTVRLVEPITLQPHSAGDLSLTANLTQALEHYTTHHPGETQMTVNFENFCLRIYGITIETTVGWQDVHISL